MTFTDPIIDFLVNFPDWLSTILIAMLPIFELRGSLPIALGTLKMPLWQAFLFSIIGNMIPVPIILLLLRRVVKFANRFSIGRKFFDHLFERTRRKTGKKIERYEAVALIMFVAIPLPITGAWTGAFAAWMFDIEFKKAIFYIFLGVLIAGVIVTTVFYLAKELLRQSFWGFVAAVVFLVLLFIGYKVMTRQNGEEVESRDEG